MKKKYYVFVPRWRNVGKLFEIWCDPTTKAARRKAYNFAGPYSILHTSYLYDGDTGELLGIFTRDPFARECIWDKAWGKPVPSYHAGLSTLAEAIKKVEEW